MQFSDPPRRKLSDSIVPMINVVFLLLIFFLMTAQIAPPMPFEVTPPNAAAQGDPTEADLTLYLSADGDLGYRDVRGPGALPALQQALIELCETGDCGDNRPTLILRADGAVEGALLARLMPQLAQAGFSQIQLVTVPK